MLRHINCSKMTGYVKVDADGGSDGPPIERIAPYSQMYSYRASKIRELRDSKAIMNSSDIINSRANSGLSVPLADESKLHYSRRSFDAQRSLSVQRYRQRTQTEISLGNRFVILLPIADIIRTDSILLANHCLQLKLVRVRRERRIQIGIVGAEA